MQAQGTRLLQLGGLRTWRRVWRATHPACAICAPAHLLWTHRGRGSRWPGLSTCRSSESSCSGTQRLATMPRSRSAAGVGWSGCSCANCNKKRNVGLRSEDIELLSEDLADLLDQGAPGAAGRPPGPPAAPAGGTGAGRRQRHQRPAAPLRLTCAAPAPPPQATSGTRTTRRLSRARRLGFSTPTPWPRGSWVAAVSAGDGDRLSGAWRELGLEDNIDDFYRCEAAGQLLILAAQLGKAAVLRPLLGLGASLDAVDEHGHQGPALLHAASAGNVNVVRALLEVRWASAPWLPQRRRCRRELRALEPPPPPRHAPPHTAPLNQPCPQAGASPDQQDVRGQSALIVAVLADRAAVAEVLLAAGADANRADSFGATPIWYCGQFNALDCIPGAAAAAACPPLAAAWPCCLLAVALLRPQRARGHVALPWSAGIPDPAVPWCLACCSAGAAWR